MSVFGICMVRDEMDILPYTLPRMLDQLDGCIVADNRSTDGTSQYLDEAEREWANLIVVDDLEPAYLQSVKMTALAHEAADRGAEWVVPFDADEVWCIPVPLSAYLPALQADVAEAALYDHVVTGRDVPYSDPVLRIRYRRREAGALPKVACRVKPGLVIEQGNHGAHYPGRHVQVRSDIHIRHYPYRSVQQMVRKAVNGAAAYQAAGDRLPPSAGRHWRDYGRFYEQGGEQAIAEIFQTWFYEEEPSSQLICDPCPVAMP